MSGRRPRTTQSEHLRGSPAVAGPTSLHRPAEAPESRCYQMHHVDASITTRRHAHIASVRLCFLPPGPHRCSGGPACCSSWAPPALCHSTHSTKSAHGMYTDPWLLMCCSSFGRNGNMLSVLCPWGLMAMGHVSSMQTCALACTQLGVSATAHALTKIHVGERVSGTNMHACPSALPLTSG